MMHDMRDRIICLAVAVLLVVMSPLSALAADDPSKVYDGRLEGYGRNLTLDAGGSALIWLLFIGIATIGLGVMFKNAQRSHLD